jgi:hypothetical protein
LGSLVGRVFILSACGAARGPRPLPLPDGPSTDQQRVDAMLSIHAHAYPPDRGFGQARFMEFDDAIEVLLEDRGQGADSRVRRAIAKLSSHGWERADFRLAIEKLLLSRVAATMRAVLCPRPACGRRLVLVRTASQGSAIALLSIAISGCWAIRPPVPPLPHELTNEGRLRAMLSVHAHYFWPDGQFPEDVRPVPLEDATRYLAADAASGENRPAWSRRRRAIAEIAAVGLPRHSFTNALGAFGLTPKDILGALCLQFDCSKLSQVPASELFTRIADLSVVRGEAVDCASQWKLLQFTVAPANASHAAYTAKITVPRAVADVGKAIDPQTWDHCSKFFCFPERTYLAHLDSTNKVITDPQLPFGSLYSPRTLFERFTCTVKDCKNTTFQNLLHVEAYDLAPRRQVNYGLEKYLDGSADGWSKEDVEILIDTGQLWAEPDTTPGWTVTYADKTLLFKSDFLTGAVNGAWSLGQAELTGELAEMACCEITSTPPTKCP